MQCVVRMLWDCVVNLCSPGTQCIVEKKCIIVRVLCVCCACVVRVLCVCCVLCCAVCVVSVCCV